MAIDVVNSVQADLAEIIEEWDRAERLIKQAELVRGKVVLASINELRYGGRRLVDALQSLPKDEHDEDGIVRFRALLSETAKFCQRAQHDAIDATVLFVQKTLKAYSDEFGEKILAKSFPAYFTLNGYIAEANQLIAMSREDRIGRQAIYIDLADRLYPEFLKYYNQLKSSRELFTTLVSEQNIERGRIKSQKRWGTFKEYLFPVILVVIGAILGAYAQAYWFNDKVSKKGLIEHIVPSKTISPQK